MKLLSLFRAGQSEDKVLDGNPYLNARRTMNEATGAIIASRQIWQAVALISMLITVGAVGGLIHIFRGNCVLFTCKNWIWICGEK